LVSKENEVSTYFGMIGWCWGDQPLSSGQRKCASFHPTDSKKNVLHDNPTPRCKKTIQEFSSSFFLLCLWWISYKVDKASTPEVGTIVNDNISVCDVSGKALRYSGNCCTIVVVGFSSTPWNFPKPFL